MPNRLRLMVLLCWLRYGPPVQARVLQALNASVPDLVSKTDLSALTDLTAAIRRAARFVPGSRCLDQALACWIVAQRLGLPARLNLGIRRQPQGTTAHAWISAGDQPIAEDPEALRQLLPLLSGAVPAIREFD
ncbi:hypothetical protein C7S18_17620 [Ahniella affigens]|uniref:Microcin J25-processing protein McjB C-terminal domain-containing protein n=1 Tax=Ahniella affigens TaxID=2021234 RepID=A0A2P1PVS8_9GAMM|nr:lasso peptide biosynthesis B2 protein [Ahniella affigens]AVP98884.1 hypothetical protein C7S18_17620 [Ahniella affigens]